MKNIEKRRKLNNLKKALLIAGFTAGITACTGKESKVEGIQTSIEENSSVSTNDNSMVELQENFDALDKAVNELIESYERLKLEKVEEYEYLVPSGYALTQDENGEYIGVAYINGERVTVEAQKFLKATYFVPEGYTLGKDSEGNYIAIKDSISENDKEEKQKIR